MPRDIKDAQIANPLQGSVSGRQGNNIAVLEQDDFSIMRDVVPKAVGIFTGVMNTANEAAFKEGQADRAADAQHMSGAVDQTAALVAERSWLTRDAYEQGVKYQDFTETQLDIQQRIQQQSSESAEAGDSVEVFSNKIKKHLATLNDRVHSSGLQGQARAAAQDQLLGYIATTQKAYQGDLEAVTTDRIKRGASQQSAATVEAVAKSGGDVGAVLTHLQTNWVNANSSASLIDRKKSLSIASKNQAGTIENILAKVNPSSPQDNETVNGISVWLDQTEHGMDPDVVDQLRGKIDSTMQLTRGVNASILADRGNALAESISTGGALDVTSASRYEQDLRNAGATQRISTSDMQSQLGALSKLRIKANKAMGEVISAVDMQPQQRLAAGITDSKHAKSYSQYAAKLYANDPLKVGPALIQQGVDFSNPELIKQGVGYLINPLLTKTAGRTGAELANEDNTEAEQSLRVITGLFNGNMGNTGLQGTLLKGMPEGDERTAFFNILAENKTLDMPTFANKFAEEKVRVKQRRESGVATKITFDSKFIDDNSSAFGQLGGLNSATGSEWFHAVSDEVKTNQAAELTDHYKRNAGVLKDRGWNIDTPAMAMAAMRSEGMLIRMPQGEIPMSTLGRQMFTGTSGKLDVEKTQATLIELGERMVIDKGEFARTQSVFSALTGGDLASGDNTISDMMRGTNGILSSKLNIDNMRYDITDGGVTVQAYTDEGTPIAGAKHHYPAWEVREAVNKPLEPGAISNAVASIPGRVSAWRREYITKQTSGNGPVIDKVMSGTYGDRDLVEIYPDTNKVFGGSNYVKSAVHRQLYADENFIKTPRATDPARPEVITVGYGVTESTYKDMMGADKWDMYVKAASYGRDYPPFMKMHDDFFNAYFTQHSMADLVSTAGLPPLDESVTDPGVYKTLASMNWHGPKSAQVMARAIKSVREGGEVDEAIAAVQSTPAYQQSKGARRQAILNVLENYR
jgi:hypothetical protein